MTAKAATKPVRTHPYVQVLTAIAIGIAFGYFWSRDRRRHETARGATVMPRSGRA